MTKLANSTDLFSELEQEFNQLDPKVSRESFIATTYFNLITDSEELDKAMLCQILDVMRAIRDKRSFNHLRYLIVINTRSIVEDWLDWGTSIRHPWIREEKLPLLNAICRFLEAENEETVDVHSS